MPEQEAGGGKTNAQSSDDRTQRERRPSTLLLERDHGRAAKQARVDDRLAEAATGGCGRRCERGGGAFERAARIVDERGCRRVATRRLFREPARDHLVERGRQLR